MKELGPRVVVACALVAFGATQWWMSERIGSWSEETSTYPSREHAILVVGRDGTPTLDSCAGAARLRASPTRPVVALCAGGRTWPVVGTAYTSTWPYWPLGAVLPFDVFALRKLSLLLGMLTLLLGHAIARRVADANVAAAGVAIAALSSPFVVPHCLLVHFELLQLPLVVLAAQVALGAPDAMLGRARAAGAGALAGLALAVNVKAAFLLGPLVVLAWRTGKLPALRPGALAAFFASALVPLVPMLALGLAVPGGTGLGPQVSMRFANIAARVGSGTALLEPLNCVRFWTDIASYGEEASGRPIGTPIWTFAVPALSLVFVTVHFVRALARRTHDTLAAIVGALVVPYVVLGALLWDQVPAANYSPLHAVFGFGSAVAMVALARWLAVRTRLPVQALVAALVAFAVAGAAWDTFRTGDPARQESGTNAVAQRAATRVLLERPGGLVVTVTYNLAGVLDGVSGGRVRSVDAKPLLDACGVAASHDDVDADCVARRLADVARKYGPVRIVMPAVVVASDERAASQLGAAMRILAASSEMSAHREASVRGAGTPPLLEIWSVRARAPE